MAFRFDAGHAFAQEVTLSVGSIGASAIGTQVFSVAGVEPDYAYEVAAPVAFSADFYVIGAKCLSQHNLQLVFQNATGSGIAHGSTVFKINSR